MAMMDLEHIPGKPGGNTPWIECQSVPESSANPPTVRKLENPEETHGKWGEHVEKLSKDNKPGNLEL